MNPSKDSDTLLIRLNHAEARNLLRQLEAMDVIRILKSEHSNEPNFKEKYWGKLSRETSEQLQKHVHSSREEWENRI